MEEERDKAELSRNLKSEESDFDENMLNSFDEEAFKKSVINWKISTKFWFLFLTCYVFMDL